MSIDKLYIELSDLIESFKNECEDISYYLNLSSGEIIKVSSDYCADETAFQIDYGDSEKFLRIVPLSLEEHWKMHEKFLKQVSDEKIRDKLELALTHRGPLRRFVEIIKGYDEIYSQWKQFQEQYIKIYIQKWINGLDVCIELV